MLSGGMDQGRLSVEIRGEDLDEARRLARERQQGDAGHARASPMRALGGDEGRPEFAVRVDRPKAALFGLT